ncbi:hypothetical protein ACJX0J_029036, partial [Zea mays]
STNHATDMLAVHSCTKHGKERPVRILENWLKICGWLMRIGKRKEPIIFLKIHIVIWICLDPIDII